MRFYHQRLSEIISLEKRMSRNYRLPRFTKYQKSPEKNSRLKYVVGSGAEKKDSRFTEFQIKWREHTIRDAL
ncbi:hypothetical protein MPTK1_1g07330 [Marchantia polymorpha subsp. ruderalis]|uniref:Uncharacterized protein n=2 Tax=Marchantia polymorpha TaxID=3197 RepID=A0AAF6AMI4_MARPO|nr:hypothetical protein MARPO_0043s0126 [Marchantia polymorpha]BBM97654.1 hypothetical protein Mp_1g07330 [Marchantia polymorpha subsp. ruderalis]|eukprot:PTQ39896.1 hypothetical protein MARPO_0043s0126 [Marchantia polymorpha]